jgi:hypothetical protein
MTPPNKLSFSYDEPETFKFGGSKDGREDNNRDRGESTYTIEHNTSRDYPKDEDENLPTSGLNDSIGSDIQLE